MPTKIEDGFEMPSSGTPSIRPVAQCSSMTPTMILAVIAIVLFAGGLGFVGGMQINKSPPHRKECLVHQTIINKQVRKLTQVHQIPI